MITQNENGTWVVRGKLEEDRTIDIRSIGAAIAREANDTAPKTWKADMFFLRSP